jgi:dTDP-glucose pyrophosphorylase
LNYNNPISPPGKGRGELEITDVNNYYIDQGRMGYKVLDGYWSDAGTFWSLLRSGMIVKKHRFIIITLLIYFRWNPTPAKMHPHNI